MSGEDDLEWKFVQSFGDDNSSDDDLVTAVEFEETGDYLAVGDKAGRICIFEGHSINPNESKMKVPLEYKFYTEFQSHEPEFDCLKSLEIEEKINMVKWGKRQPSGLYLLAANDKTIKYWKVHEKKIKRPNRSIRPGIEHDGPIIPRLSHYQTITTATPKKIYANAHGYHINSISINSDYETFMSADDLRINMWNFEISNECFNIVDVKPPNLEELTEVITSATFHPSQCNLLLYSSSRGSIRLGDLRDSALCDHHSKLFEIEEDPASKSFFSEIVASISDAKFTPDGRYIISRDYLSLKVWDVNMESKPVAVVPIHDYLKMHLCDLYENDCFAAGTLVTTGEQTSLPIEQVAVGARVLGVAPSGLVLRAVTAAVPKGKQACVELLFDDGRSIVCTPDHRIFTAAGEWVMAKDLVVGESQVSAGIEYPMASSLPNNYAIQSGKHVYRGANALRFARLIGCMMAGGVLSEDGRSGHLTMEHQLDVASVQADVLALCGKEAEATRSEGGWRVVLPRALTLAMRALVSGSRHSQLASFPAFVQQSDCPRAVLSEFLGGFLGGNGHTLVYSLRDADQLTGLGITCSKKDVSSLPMPQLQQWRSELLALLARCGVDTDMDIATGAELKLTIGTGGVLQFARNVGFRHASLKQLRLTAAASYFRGVEYVTKQRSFIQQRVAELGTDITQAVRQAKDELSAREVLHPDIADWSPLDSTDPAHQQPTPSQCAEEWGTARFFSERSTKLFGAGSALPTFRVRLVGRRDAGVREVFDLSVPSGRPQEKGRAADHYDSFQANGVVVHNCIFDKFECASSPDGKNFLTGSYNNNFVLHSMDSKSSVTIEALKDSPKRKPKDKGKDKGKRSRKLSKATMPNVNLMDFGKKALHVSWHPQANCVAVAGLNKLYIYQAS